MNHFLIKKLNKSIICCNSYFFNIIKTKFTLNTRLFTLNIYVLINKNKKILILKINIFLISF